MKKVLFMSAVAAVAFSGFAHAGNFDENAGEITFQKDKLEFSTGYAETNGFDAYKVMYEVYSGFIGDYQTWSKVGAFYLDDSETYGLLADFEVWKNVRQFDRVYAGAKAHYVIDSDIEEVKHSAVVTPRVGYELGFNTDFAAFTEIAYNFDASNNIDEKDLGGYAQIGFIYDNGAVEVKPSIVKEFDTENDDTNLNVKMKVRF